MDFNILHLSDLHISKRNDTLQRILDDIKEQIEDIHDIVIVVTGDIVDKGIYDSITKANVLNFFENLYKILGEKFKGCFIVPGNHDKSQTISSNMLTNCLCQSKEAIVFSREDWNYQLLAYKNFLDLEDEIYRIFYPKDIFIKTTSHSNTYGVEVYQNHQSTIIFIKIDTAWCSLGGSKDKRNLRISKAQLEALTDEYKKKYQENQGKRIFTIALCHHPLNWLTEEDEAILYSYLTNSDFLNTDVLLCGHTHDADIENLFSTTHQITTFVTGIGWSEKTPIERRNEHRYSIYIFNLRRNSCEIIVRKTDMRGRFDIDRDFFPDDESKNKGRLLLPILPRNSHPFIGIPTCSKKDLNYTPLFLDNIILKYIKECNCKLLKLKIHMSEYISFILRNCIEDFKSIKEITEDEKKDLLKNYFYNNNKEDAVFEIMKQNTEEIYAIFTALLYELCTRFITLFKEHFENDENIRILFRLCVKGNYKQVCYQSKHNIEIETLKKDIIPKDNLARELKFEGLIEKAFRYNCALVYSSNQWYNSFEPERWKNYICIVPSFENMKLYYDNIRKREVPYIVCTISIISEKDSIFLDILNYIGIKECISEVIESFVKLFNVDYEEYCGYMSDKNYI